MPFSLSRSISVLAIALMATACGSSKPPLTPADDAEGDSSSGPAEVGKMAPGFSLETLNGKGTVSRDALAGKVVIVDFWATWCGPCKESFPKLEELAKKHAGTAEIIGVSCDDTDEGVADFAKSFGVTFPIAWDDGHGMANRWKFETMPTTYVLDTTGTVRYIHSGYHNGEAEKLSQEIAELAAESPSKSKSEPAPAAVAEPDPPSPPADTAEPEDEPADEPPPPPKKKGGKKGAGKKPAGKKPAKKKK